MSKAGLLAMLVVSLLCAHVYADTQKDADLSSLKALPYDQARWHALHFKPASESASDDQCLACHAEILETRVRAKSPAGVKASEALAWYATLDTYSGDEETFHRRHLVTDYAKQVMDLKCRTCHLGNDPREEVGMSHAGGDPTLTQRKQVDPNICLLCHGQFPYEIMAIPGPWVEFGSAFQNNCLLCHTIFRTHRHQVNYLKPEAIEKLATEKQDVCFGCHGGRSWYGISYPYPRHAWPGMAETVPEWAKGRPTESEPRFLLGVAKPKPQAAKQPAKSSKPDNEPQGTKP